MKPLLYYGPEDVLFLPLPLYLRILTLHIASVKVYFIFKYLHYDSSPQPHSDIWSLIFLVPVMAHTDINLCLHLCVTDLDIFKWQFL